MLTCASSIVQSRKRKLRELFAVATDEDGIPTHDFANPDAPATTSDEEKFILDLDIFLCVVPDRAATFFACSDAVASRQTDHGTDPCCSGRRFRLEHVPSCRPRSFDVIKAYPPVAQDLKKTDALSQSHVVPDQPVENGLRGPVPDGPDVGVGIPCDQHPAINGNARSPIPVQAVPLAQNGTAGTGTRGEDVAVADQGPSKRPRLEPSTNAGFIQTAQADAAVDGAAVNGDLKLDRATAQIPIPIPIPIPLLPASVETQLPPPTNLENGASVADAAPRPPSPRGGLKPVDAGGYHGTSQGESSRFPDAASSPGSPAQSTLTTTAHEGSTNTSPDNEGPQYTGKGDEESGEGEERTEQDITLGSAAAPTEAGLGASGPATVEAQLLQESAAAQLSQTAAREQKAASDLAVASQGRVEQAEDRAAVTAPASTGQDVPMVGSEDHHEKGSLPVAVGMAPPIPAPEAASAQNESSGDVMETDTVEPPAALNVALPEAPAVQPPLPTPPIFHAAAPSAPLVSSSAIPQAPSTAISPHQLFSPSNVAASDAPNGPVSAPASATAPPPQQSSEMEKDAKSQTLSITQLRLLALKNRKDRRRSVPTVIFGKPKSRKKPSTADDTAMVVRQDPADVGADDYFTPLFIEGFARSPETWMKPIEKLLNQAHKTVSTSDHYLSVLDHQACKILRRVYHLQQHDKWSLRQPVRCPEPTRPPSHLDLLLQEMKWMRTDFREERKWKRAVARNLARACAEWVEASPVDRLLMQVNAVVPPPRPVVNEDDTDEPLPDLVHSDSLTEEPLENEDPQEVSMCIAPAAIFGLQDDEVVFPLQPSKTTDLLLSNLPMYGSPLTVPKFDLVGSEYDPDARWRRPALPLSKYVEGEMVLDLKPPPRKRGRYQYPVESSDDDEVVFGAQPDANAHTQPENPNVALFNPENRATRARLYVAHQFRPPSPLPMPSQSFYECRTASQWTLQEDDKLKSLVREYHYHWSLISSILSTRSKYHSGAERRTPWECFERWVALEGMPADAGKMPYFRTYQSRIDAAQKVIMQLNQNIAQQQQQQVVGANGAVTPIPRKRPTTTMRVERRRNQKHLAMIDAMRKLAKKRETAQAKAQHAASLATMRKANEAPRPQQQPPLAKTPREYSLMRFERDQQLADRMAQYARRSEVQKRVRSGLSLAVANTDVDVLEQQLQSGQMTGGASSVSQQAAAAQLAAANARVNMGGQGAVPPQGRPQVRMPMPGGAAGVSAAQAAQLAGGLVPPLPIAALPQAQLQSLQGHAQVQHRLPVVPPQPDINLVLQARSIQAQQQAVLQQQQRQQQQHQHQLQTHPSQPLAGQQQMAQQHPLAGQQPQQGLHMANVQNSRISPSVQAAHMAAAQGSSPPIRNLMNAMNQGGGFTSNAQAMMASFSAANPIGMATSPNAGLNMPSMAAGSPHGVGLAPNLAARLRDLENLYRQQIPNATPDIIRQRATEHLGRLIVQNQRESAAAAAAAANNVGQPSMNGIATPSATASPHQYAQLLRAQQAQQAQVVAQQHQQALAMTHQQQQHQQAQQQQQQQQQVQQQQQQQQAAQQQQQQQQQAAQHQRQASGSATPAPK